MSGREGDDGDACLVRRYHDEFFFSSQRLLIPAKKSNLVQGVQQGEQKYTYNR